MPVNRGRMTTAPALVHGVVDTIHTKRNDSIMNLQGKMEATSQWLDDAITSAKRKIVEGTGVSVHDVQKKAKTVASSNNDSKIAAKHVQILSPVRDKENSPNNNNNNNNSFTRNVPQPQKVFVKPPPSAVKRKVNSMRVVDLRKELKSKGLETKGLKKDLQHRILQAYTTVESTESPQKNTSSPPSAVVPEANDSKPSPVDANSKEVEQEEPGKTTATPAPEDHSDTDSVEVIIVGSPSAAQKVDESKIESKEEAPQSTDGEGLEEPAKATTNDECNDSVSMEIADAVKIAPSKISKSPRNSSMSLMDIDPAKKASIASSTSEAADVKSVCEKRVSLMDCDTVEESVSNKSLSTSSVSSPATKSIAEDDCDEKASPPPKVTTSLEASETEKTANSETDNTLESSKAPERSRKVSQESLPKTSRERTKMLAKSASNSSLLAKAGNAANAESNKRATGTQNEPEKQSPLKKRVQAAIQMLTAASNKSPAKPTTTPSKLAWLIKHQTKAAEEQPKSELKISEPAALKQIQEEGSNVKQQVHQKAEKLAAAARRPGMGLTSSATTMSSSALKTSSRYLAGKPNSALSSSAQATNEARKARLAEIRGKSKPVSKPASFVAKTFSATKDLTASSLSALKAKTATAEDSKRKLLTAQMREKAARKQMEAKAAPDSIAPAPSTASKAQAIVNQAASVAQAAHKSPEKSLVKSAKAAFTPDALSALRPQLLSPMDTYEISDREDSDSESESESEEEDDNNSRKKIPEWAQRANLIPALEKQFAQGNGRFDPDEIFPEVKTCNLQAIFDSKKARYIRRTSSGNWTKDRVTPGEKLTYKRTMGYADSKKR